MVFNYDKTKHTSNNLINVKLLFKKINGRRVTVARAKLTNVFLNDAFALNDIVFKVARDNILFLASRERANCLALLVYD